MVSLESLLSRPVSEKLTSNHLPQSDAELLQVLVLNSSREGRTLRAELSTLHTQVLLRTLDANTVAGSEVRVQLWTRSAMLVRL